MSQIPFPLHRSEQDPTEILDDGGRALARCRAVGLPGTEAHISADEIAAQLVKRFRCLPAELTEEDLLTAWEQLALSERGRNALRRLSAWLDDDGLGLDVANQEAVFTLLAGAWGKFAGTARDLMRAGHNTEDGA